MPSECLDGIVPIWRSRVCGGLAAIGAPITVGYWATRDEAERHIGERQATWGADDYQYGIAEVMKLAAIPQPDGTYLAYADVPRYVRLGEPRWWGPENASRMP